MKNFDKDPAGLSGTPRLLRVWRSLMSYLMALLLFTATVQAQTGSVPVNPPAVGFNIDGGLKVNSALGDWVAGSTGTGSYVFNNDGTPVAGLSGKLIRDAYSSNTDIVFAEGSKFNSSPNEWAWTTGTTTDKNDINNAMYLITTDPASGDTWLIIGGDRLSTNGTSYIDFEFLQKSVTRNLNNNKFTSTGTDGGRTLNDMTITVGYSGGGSIPTVTAYIWSPASRGTGFEYKPVPPATLEGKIFAATNLNAVDVPFLAFGNPTYQPFAFVEAAINITLLFGTVSPCIGINVDNIIIKTKASDVETAALKDFVEPIPVELSLATAEFSYPAALCNTGKASVSYTMGSVRGGTFSSTAGLSINSSTGEIDLAASTPGTYTVTYTFITGGCTRTATTQVTVNSNPTTPAVSLSQPTCAVATGTITVTSPTGTGYTYSVDGGTTWQSATVFENLAPVTYTVLAKNASGCIATGNAVTINAQPGTPAAPVFVQNQEACQTDVIPTLTASVTVPDKVSIVWYNEAGQVITDPSLSAIGTVTYYAEAVNEQGCVSKTRTAVTLTINSRPGKPVLEAVHPTCAVNTGTIKLTSGTDNLTFSINNAAFKAYPENGFAGLPAGDYTVVAMNSAGCISQEATITLNAQPETPAKPQFTVSQPTCAVATGKMVISSPTAEGLLYSINGVDYQPETTFDNLTEGNYTVTVKSAAGCVSPGEPVTVNKQPETPSAPTSGGDLTACETNTVPVLTAVATAPANATVVWYTAATGGSVVENPTWNQIGTITYYAAAVSDDQCESLSRTPVKLTITGKPTKPVVQNDSFCASASASPVNLLSYVQAEGTVSFTDQDGVVLATQPTTLSLEAAGTFTYYVVQQANGCVSDVASFSITINSNPTVPEVSLMQPTCAQAGKITVTSPTGTGLLYSLDGAAWQSETVFADLTAGTYTVYVKNSSGCITQGAPVTINLVPAAPAMPVVKVTQPTCTDATATLEVTSATTDLLFKLNDGVFAPYPNGGYSLPAGSTYTLVAKSVAECLSPAASGTILPQPATPTKPVAAVIQPNCAVATGTITVTMQQSDGILYSNNGKDYQASNVFANLAPGNYSITVKNAAGCVSEATAYTILEQPATPAKPMAGNNLTACETTTIPTLTATASAPAGVIIVWYDAPQGGEVVENPVLNKVGSVTYYAEAQTEAGCVSAERAAVILTINAKPGAPVLTASHPTCSEATGSITIEKTDGLEFSLDGKPFGAYPVDGFTGLSAGLHTVIARNEAGCMSDVASITINVQPQTPAKPTVAIVDPTCEQAGSITVTAPLGANYTYSIDGKNWQEGTAFNGLAAATYQVWVKNADNCISEPTAVTNPVPAAPAAPLVQLTEITCDVSTAVLTITSPTAGLLFSFNDGAFGPYPVVGYTLNAGSAYKLVAKNTAACESAPATGRVATQPITPTANAGQSKVITCNSPTVELSGSSNIEGVTYAWVASNGGHIVSGANTATPVVDAAGTYTLTVTNPEGGCSATASVNVSENKVAPVASINGSPVITCATPVVTLTGSASIQGATYSWSGPGEFKASTAVVEATVAGVYTLTVTNPANGCTDQETIEITDKTNMPVVSAGQRKELSCLVTSIMLSGSVSETDQELSYNWVASNGGNILSGANTLTPTVNKAGTYTLTVTDLGTGCQATAVTSVILNNTLPNANAGTAKVLTCAIGSVTLQGSSTTEGAAFAWEASNEGNIVSGGTTATPIVDKAGTYTLTVTHPVSGCTATSTVTVTEDKQAPAFTIGTPGKITCNTPRVTLTVSAAAGMQFSWTGPENFTSALQNIEVSVGGTYELTVTNPATGCAATSSVVVPQLTEVPDAMAGIDKVLTCKSPTVVLEGSSTYEGATVSYNWYDSEGNLVERGLTAIVDEPGVYTFVVKDENTGCSSSDAVEVTRDGTAPDVKITTAGLGRITCIETSVKLAGYSETAGITYSWRGPDNFTASTSSIEVSVPGKYELTVTNPANGCTATTSYTVNDGVVYAEVNAGPDKVLTCANPTVTLEGFTNNPQVDSWRWEASNGGELPADAHTLTPVISVPGTYTLVVTTKSGCVSSDAVVVTGNATVPMANITVQNPPVIKCNNTTAILYGGTLTEGAILSWTGPDGFTSAEAIVEVSVPGIYTFTVTDPATGCSASDSEKVTDGRVYPEISAGPDKVLTCANSTVTLEGSSDDISGIMNYYWTASNGGNILSGERTMNPIVNAAGTYTLTMRNMIIGCESTDVVEVTSNTKVPSLSINSGDDIRLTCERSSVNVLLESDATNPMFVWSGPEGFTSNQKGVTITIPGDYTITVTDLANGCTNTTILAVGGPSTPNLTAGPDKVLTCANSTVMLEAFTSIPEMYRSFRWTASDGGNIVSGAFTRTPIVNAPGTYTVTMYDAMSECEASDVVVVTSEGVKPTLTATGGTLDCVTGTFQLQASSTTDGVAYSWTGPGDYTSTEQNPTVMVAGEYTVTVTHVASGCSTFATVLVNPRGNTTVPVITCHALNFGYGTFSKGLITTINTPEGPVNVMGRKRNADGSFKAGNHAALFDTQAPTGDDADLYTTDWGLALVINQDQTNLPNDNQWGGYLDLDFSAIGPVTMKSLKALDIDGYENMSWVYLYDGEGNELHRVKLQNLGNNSKQLVDLGNTKGVMLMRVALDGRNESGHLAGSGAIDDIEFCVEEMVEGPCKDTAEETDKTPVKKPVVHLRAYPVPFPDRTTVEFTLPVTERYMLTLYDNKGSKIGTIKEGIGKADELIQVEVDASNLAQGMYIARLEKASGSQSVKLIVHRK